MNADQVSASQTELGNKILGGIVGGIVLGSMLD
jgi:hypothetical protein